MITVDEQAIRRILWPACHGALDEIGMREAEAIRDDISFPVGRDLQGNVIRRSDPGEPPRLDTGALHANIEVELSDDDKGNPQLEIVSSRPGGVPQILEFKLNRPYMTTAYDRVQGYALPVLVDHLARAL